MWKKTEVGGVTHSVLEATDVCAWEAHVSLGEGSNLWSWRVYNTKTRELHPRGFGHEGTEEQALQKAETLVRNLLREVVQASGRDPVRARKVVSGKVVTPDTGKQLTKTYHPERKREQQ